MTTATPPLLAGPEGSDRVARLPRTRYADAFARAPVGMALVGPDDEMRSVNPALAALLDEDVGALAGRPLGGCLHRGDVERVAAALRRLRERRAERFEEEVRLCRRGGREVWVLLSASALRAGSGPCDFVVVQAHDISARKRIERRLQRLADRDALTDLWNRRHFERDLAAQVARSRRHGERAALLLLDLDHFKDVNDSFGHRVGDALLRKVADGLRARLRASDVAARLGGDEFAVLLPGATPAQGEAVAHDLVDVVRDAQVLAGEVEVSASASVGLAMIDRDVATADDAFVAADTAMYQAKAEGRARAAAGCPHDSTRHEASGRLQWSRRVRDALRDDAFELYAQPIVAADTRDVESLEVLLRLRERGNRVLTASQFMYHAERCGYAPAIDRWVLEHAAATRSPLPLAVNVSAASLRDPGFASDAERILDTAGAAPGAVTFEISETAAVASLDATREFADRMADLGCAIALDDFGAGLANFTYIKSLRFDVIKIDGDFIRGLASNPTDELVVRAIVDVAHGLRKCTVAEYVADAATLAAVRAARIDLAQGFYTGRPVPLAEALASL